ncbi:MAG TPA: hemerythrin domain-containing protein [Rhizomicrobium sp.]
MSVRAEIRKVTKNVSKAIKGDEGADDILDTLKAEHEEVSELLDKLVDSEAAGARKKLVQQIRQALIPHTKAEEKVVYDAVLALRDKDAKIDGEEGYIEHDLAAKTLDKLDKIANATSPEHKAAAKVLRELVKHHVEEEEDNIWSDVEDNFSDEQREQMNRAFLAAKKKVRV